MFISIYWLIPAIMFAYLWGRTNAELAAYNEAMRIRAEADEALKGFAMAAGVEVRDVTWNEEE